MKLVASLIGQLLAWEHTYSHIYSNDPKAEIYKYYKSNDIVIHKNAVWIDRLNHKAVQADFVTQMINIPNTIPLTPDGAFDIMDDSPFCWAILAYNSNDNELYEETIELANALSTHFYQRVTVAVLDLGYPSNFATFGDLFDGMVPALLVKHPDRMHQVFHHDDIHAEMIHVQHDDLEKWGEIITNDDLVKHPAESFRKVDEYHAASHETFKVGAVFMHHYNITEDKTSMNRKAYYPHIYKNLIKNIQGRVIKAARTLGLGPSGAKPDAKSATAEERQLNDRELYDFMMQEMNTILTNTNMMDEIESKYEEIVLSVQSEGRGYEDLLDPIKDPKIDLIPKTPLDIEPIIPKWLQLRSEL